MISPGHALFLHTLHVRACHTTRSALLCPCCIQLEEQLCLHCLALSPQLQTRSLYRQNFCRWAVFWVFPVFMTSVIIVKSVILFKRDAVRDKQVSHSSRMPYLQPDWQPDPMGKAELNCGLQEFNMFLERMLKRSPIKSLIVYPEGEVELTTGAYSPHFRLSTWCRPDPAHLLLKHAAWPLMTDPGRDLCMPIMVHCVRASATSTLQGTMCSMSDPALLWPLPSLRLCPTLPQAAAQHHVNMLPFTCRSP